MTSFSHLGRSTNKDALAHEHGTLTPVIVISAHKQSQKLTSKDSMSTIGAQEVKPSSHLGRSCFATINPTNTNKDALVHEHGTLTPIFDASGHSKSEELCQAPHRVKSDSHQLEGALSVVYQKEDVAFASKWNASFDHGHNMLMMTSSKVMECRALAIDATCHSKVWSEGLYKATHRVKSKPHQGSDGAQSLAFHATVASHREVSHIRSYM